MTQDEMERKLSASTGEAHFHYTRASYFESLVGRCHEALGEAAGSDHDSLPEAIATHIRERDQRISELERALAPRPEECRTGCAQYETCPHGYSTRSACGACGQPTAALNDEGSKK